MDDLTARQRTEEKRQLGKREEVEKTARGGDPAVQDAQKDIKPLKKRQRSDSDPLQWAGKRQKNFLERKVESKDWPDIDLEDETDL